MPIMAATLLPPTICGRGQVQRILRRFSLSLAGRWPASNAAKHPVVEQGEVWICWRYGPTPRTPRPHCARYPAQAVPSKPGHQLHQRFAIRVRVGLIDPPSLWLWHVCSGLVSRRSWCVPTQGVPATFDTAKCASPKADSARTERPRRRVLATRRSGALGPGRAKTQTLDFQKEEEQMARNTSVMGIYPDRTTVSDAVNVLNKAGYRPNGHLSPVVRQSRLEGFRAREAHQGIARCRHRSGSRRRGWRCFGVVYFYSTGDRHGSGTSGGCRTAMGGLGWRGRRRDSGLDRRTPRGVEAH